MKGKPDEPGVAATAAEDTSTGSRQIIALLMCAAFVVVLNETIMSVALPTLMVDLGIVASAAQWLTTAFLLTSAIVVPATGFLLRRFTLRALFVAAMSLFTVGTAIAAVSPEIGSLSSNDGSTVFAVLIIARIIQASGSAIMLPLLMTTVLAAVPASGRGSVMGFVSIVMSVAPAIGPTVSGLILATFEWRFLFVFILPISLAALTLGAWRVQNLTQTQPARLDVLSVALSALAFGGLIFGLSSLGTVSAGTSSSVSMSVSLAVGAVALASFVWRQVALRNTDRVLLDLRVFRLPRFVMSLVLIVAVMTALFGALIVLPLYLRQTLELDAFATGLALLPGGILMGALAPLVGRLYDRLGPQPLVLPGVVVVSAALWWMTTLDASTPVALVIVTHCVLGIGFAFAFTPLVTSGLGDLPAHLHSHGTAILSTLQKVAGAAGTALFIAVMTIGSRAAGPGTDAVATVAAGTRSAFLAGALLSLVSVVIAIVGALVLRGGEAPSSTSEDTNRKENT